MSNRPVMPLSPFGPDGLLKPEIVELFQLMGFDCKPNTSLDALTKWSSGWTNAKFRVYRWQLDEVPDRGTQKSLAHVHATRLWELGELLGFVTSPAPKFTNYTNVVVPQVTVLAGRRRHAALGYLIGDGADIPGTGIEVDHLFYPGTERKTDEKVDSIAKLLQPGKEAGEFLTIVEDYQPPAAMPPYESDLARPIWAQHPLRSNEPFFFMAESRDGDTASFKNLLIAVREHPAYNPTGPTLLVVGNPFIPFQHIVATRILGDHVDTVGYSAAQGPQDPMYLLGGIGNWFYELETDRVDS